MRATAARRQLVVASGMTRTVGNRTPGAALLLVVLAAVLASCAPQVQPSAAADDELRVTAMLAFHRMEIAYLEGGSYTTNALVDLELPKGVRWTLEEFGEDDYRLRFSRDERPSRALIVTPAGVSAVARPD